MGFLSAQQIRFFKRFFFLLLSYSLIRISFYFYHFQIFKQFTQNEIFESFFYGIRFDIAALSIINAPLFFLTLIPSSDKFFVAIERFLFVFINTMAFIAAIDDFELFLFMGKRLSIDLFVITEDIFEQLPQLLLNFWHFPLIGFLFGIAFYQLDKKFFVFKSDSLSFKRIFSTLILLLLLFVGVRGGIQNKSINVQSAFVQGKNELGHLVLNSPYHFLRTLTEDPVKRMKFFKNDDEAKNIILNRRDFRPTNLGHKNANIVLIILESFALEYLELGYTPFLSELKEEGAFFSRHLANGRRSIEALPSLLCGLPSLVGSPISKSIYSGNKFSCYPKILKENGYKNYFFHAGNRGTMGFDFYTLANGFDQYFSRADYGQKDFDGTWGTFDLPYLQYVIEKISEFKEPFSIGVFTLSSHQPYSIPNEFKGKFPKGNLEIHESIAYTDHALRKFFESAKKKSWYKNTYFIITADHSQKLETKKFSNLVGRYRVPLIILGPDIEKKEYLKVTQHSDIPGTVIDLLAQKGDMAATGASVFSQGDGAALNFADGTTYFLATGNRILTLDGEQAYNWNTGESSKLMKSEDQYLRAYLQYFLNGLINNNLSL